MAKWGSSNEKEKAGHHAMYWGHLQISSTHGANYGTSIVLYFLIFQNLFGGNEKPQKANTRKTDTLNELTTYISNWWTSKVPVFPIGTLTAKTEMAYASSLYTVATLLILSSPSWRPSIASLQICATYLKLGLGFSQIATSLQPCLENKQPQWRKQEKMNNQPNLHQGTK